VVVVVLCNNYFNSNWLFTVRCNSLKLIKMYIGLLTTALNAQTHSFWGCPAVKQHILPTLSLSLCNATLKVLFVPEELPVYVSEHLELLFLFFSFFFK